ncbi:hypothetical protein C8J57DRAFT_1016850, partial [Mycena rebaudengoi]
GALYVGISALSGAILPRNRILPTRILLPPALTFGPAHHFLPRIIARMSKPTWGTWRTFIRPRWRGHDTANAHARMSWGRMRKGHASVDGGVLGAVGSAQAATGLKLREALG